MSVRMKERTNSVASEVMRIQTRRALITLRCAGSISERNSRRARCCGATKAIRRLGDDYAAFPGW